MQYLFTNTIPCVQGEMNKFMPDLKELFFDSVEMFLLRYEIKKNGYNEGGDSTCPPIPVLSDDDEFPVRGVSHLGEP
jgi:hypothetical protein